MTSSRFLRDSPGFHLIPEVNPLPSGGGIRQDRHVGVLKAPHWTSRCAIVALPHLPFVGIAMEIGIEPTVRHGADLGYIPVVVKDACGFGHRDAAALSIASLEFAGDALLTNVETICTQFRSILSQQAVVTA